MADGRRWRPSVATRTALAAGVISAVLFVGAALWARHFVYAEGMQAAELNAQDQLNSIVLSGMRKGALPGVGELQDPLGLSFEIVHSDGRVLASGIDLKPFEKDRSIAPPPRTGEGDGLAGRWTATFPGAVHLDEADRAQVDDPYLATRYAGRQVMAVFDSRPVSGYTATPTDVETPSSPTVSVYVFVLPFDAEDAVAEIDRVLRFALPAAVLLVMLVAFFATTMGLRPVERIRAEAAGITSRDLHRRVPVPPTRDAVARLASTLNATLDRLQKSSEQQRRFVADVTHELRSPVASLRAVLEVASEHRDRADWPVVTGNAIADVKRIQALVDDLLLLAKFDAEQPAPVEPLDLGQLAKRHVAGRPAYDGITTTCEAANNLIVDGNARELERLLRNLLDNAERHARTKVHVSVHREADEAVLDVIDDGPGIPAADRTRVFERFVRLDESRSRDEGGAGLGLAIAHDIATRHHATITIDASPSGGTRLSVRIPLLNAELTTSEAGA